MQKLRKLCKNVTKEERDTTKKFRFFFCWGKDKQSRPDITVTPVLLQPIMQQSSFSAALPGGEWVWTSM